MSKLEDRFLIINTQYVPDEEHFWMIIADYMWWGKYEPDILQWAKECLGYFKIEGMMIKFKTEEDRNLFILRWAYG